MDKLNDIVRPDSTVVEVPRSNPNEALAEKVTAVTGQSLDLEDVNAATKTPAAQPLPDPVSTPADKAAQLQTITGLPFTQEGIMKEFLEQNLDTSPVDNPIVPEPKTPAETTPAGPQSVDEYMHDEDRRTAAVLARLERDEEERLAEAQRIAAGDPVLQSMAPAATAATVPESFSGRERDQRWSSNVDAGYLDDLTPGYSDDAVEETPEVEPEAPDPGDENYADYVRNLEDAVVKVEEHRAIDYIRDTKVKTVANGRNRVTSLGDQAFANAIAKFKRDNFGKITVPLVNSGFLADMTGTGVVDLQNLYMNVDENTTTDEFRADQMKTVIRNVVGTHPTVSASTLSSMIHYQDYQMMAYGHVCATIRTVQIADNCPECGRPFKCSTESNNLLLNQEEIYERRRAIEAAPNVEAYSLMTKNREVETADGILVVLSHPSYSEFLQAFRGYQTFVQRMDTADAYRFRTLLETLYMIRKIVLPNGVTSRNILQHYQALMLLTDVDVETVTKEVVAMQKEVLVPQFGIREARCPHCGRIIRNIRFRNLMELLTFHFTVSGVLRAATAGN